MSKEQEQGQSKIFKTNLKSENTHKHVITRNNSNEYKNNLSNEEKAWYRFHTERGKDSIGEH